jgi:hypothetical protein
LRGLDVFGFNIGVSVPHVKRCIDEHPRQLPCKAVSTAVGVFAPVGDGDTIA